MASWRREDGPDSSESGPSLLFLAPGRPDFSPPSGKDCHHMPENGECTDPRYLPLW